MVKKRKISVVPCWILPLCIIKPSLAVNMIIPPACKVLGQQTKTQSINYKQYYPKVSRFTDKTSKSLKHISRIVTRVNFLFLNTKRLGIEVGRECIPAKTMFTFQIKSKKCIWAILRSQWLRGRLVSKSNRVLAIID